MKIEILSLFFLLTLVLVGAQDEECSVIEIEYEELIKSESSESLLAKIGEAYGSDGLGILAVTGIPREIESHRVELLGLGRKLALLPASSLEKYERPEHNYVVGWSRGREKFRGVEDVAKGSWYANGLYAEPAQNESDTLKAKYPASTAEPLWPTSDELGADLESSFRQLGSSLYQVSRHVLRHCDAWLANARSLLPWHLKLRIHLATLFQKKRKLFSLEHITHELSRLHVARLLHYFPDAPLNTDGGDWCGWHNDNSVLTALVPAVFINDSTGLAIKKPPPGSGLYVQPRAPNAQPIHVLPPSVSPYLLFQIGEAAQILSGGLLRATPHAVMRGDDPQNTVSRDTFALFVEPHWDFPLAPPPGVPLTRVYGNKKNDNQNLIPPLRSRLTKVPVDFAQFLADSVTEYYKP